MLLAVLISSAVQLPSLFLASAYSDRHGRRGIYMLGDLLYIKLTNSSAVCDLSEEVSCTAVNQSEFSEVLGIPIGAFGIAFFLLAIYLSLYRKGGQHSTRMAFLMLAGILSFIPAIYLSILEHLVIDIICPFCESSKVLMLGVMALALPSAKGSKYFSKKAVIVVAIIAIQGSIFTYMLQQKTAGAGLDYTEFVQCLVEEENVLMYGSFRCGNCAQQRRILGEDLFHEIPIEIECHPDGENAQLALCEEKGVEHTPTWIQEDEDGNQTQFVEGFQRPADLAALFGCEDRLPGQTSAILGEMPLE